MIVIIPEFTLKLSAPPTDHWLTTRYFETKGFAWEDRNTVTSYQLLLVGVAVLPMLAMGVL